MHLKDLRWRRQIALHRKSFNSKKNSLIMLKKSLVSTRLQQLFQNELSAI